MNDFIISKCTSSGFIKRLAINKKGIVLSPEVFDILNKLFKSDEDNATGDVQLLCKLFSGEKCSYHYSTEESRVIPPNTPFCILGSTQLFNAAKLIARMDHGHGLVDRILLATPLAFRPTLTEMEAASEQITTEVVNDFRELFLNISEIEDNVEFTFDDQGKEFLRDTMDQFVEVNAAIREGKVPPKSKDARTNSTFSMRSARFQPRYGGAIGRRFRYTASNCHFQSNPRECSIFRRPP